MRLFASVVDTKEEDVAGVCLTFDDTGSETWKKYHDDHGKQRNWIANFFVFEGTALQTQYFQYLFTEGHAFENHTINHFNDPEGYIQGGGTPEGYYNTYLKPLDDFLIANGIDKPTCFRYPFNNTEDSITSYLLDNGLYDFITPGIAGNEGDQFERPFDCMFKNVNYPEALKFDRNTGSYDPDYFITLLEYARDANKIAIFFGHDIEPASRPSTVDISLLNNICDFINANDMKFWKMRDMVKFL